MEKAKNCPIDLDRLTCVESAYYQRIRILRAGSVSRSRCFDFHLKPRPFKLPKNPASKIEDRPAEYRDLFIEWRPFVYIGL